MTFIIVSFAYCGIFLFNVLCTCPLGTWMIIDLLGSHAIIFRKDSYFLDMSIGRKPFLDIQSGYFTSKQNLCFHVNNSSLLKVKIQERKKKEEKTCTSYDWRMLTNNRINSWPTIYFIPILVTHLVYHEMFYNIVIEIVLFTIPIARYTWLSARTIRTAGWIAERPKSSELTNCTVLMILNVTVRQVFRDSMQQRMPVFFFSLFRDLASMLRFIYLVGLGYWAWATESLMWEWVHV